jgi:hypothetical protein
MESVGAVRELETQVRRRMVDVTFTIDPPASSTGSWWIDVQRYGRIASIEWKPGKGFGVAAPQLGQIALQPGEQRGVIDDAVFDDLGEAGTEFTGGQCGKRIQITEDKFGLIECTDEIFARLQVHADFATNGTVHMREQCGRNLHERNPAQITCRNETGEIVVSDGSPEGTGQVIQRPAQPQGEK